MRKYITLLLTLINNTFGNIKIFLYIDGILQEELISTIPGKTTGDDLIKQYEKKNESYKEVNIINAKSINIPEILKKGKICYQENEDSFTLHKIKYRNADSLRYYYASINKKNIDITEDGTITGIKEKIEEITINAVTQKMIETLKKVKISQLLLCRFPGKKSFSTIDLDGAQLNIEQNKLLIEIVREKYKDIINNAIKEINARRKWRTNIEYILGSKWYSDVWGENYILRSINERSTEEVIDIKLGVYIDLYVNLEFNYLNSEERLREYIKDENYYTIKYENNTKTIKLPLKTHFITDWLFQTEKKLKIM